MLRPRAVRFLLLLPLVAAAPRAHGQEAGLDAFFPLVTRRPVVEREVELGARHQRGAAGRETAATLSLDWIPLTRWQVSLSVPAVFTDPGDRAPAGGVGDLQLETKVVLPGAARGPHVAAGVALTLPTGDRGRGLGGETAVAPFLTAGAARGPFYLVGELGYRWEVARGRAQDATAGLATGYRAHPRVIPLVELTAASRLRRGDDERGAPPLERAQLYLAPGVNVLVRENTTLGVGVQLPLTSARAFDYALVGSLDWDF